MPDFAHYPSLRGRAVLVSGGGSGIGASMVEHFAAQGARVAFVDIDETASRALIAGIARAGHPAPAFEACDVRDIAGHRAAIETADDVDPVTEDLLIGQTGELEQYQWFVRAHLESADGALPTASADAEAAERAQEHAG